MNREIRFRAWHKGFSNRSGTINPEMLYDEDPGDCLVWARFQPIKSVMQFTGLYDKNGAEIYEGDIVHTTGNDTVGIIRFGEYLAERGDCDGADWQIGFYWEEVPETESEWKEPFGRPDPSMAIYEVIGNIYENHELLEKK